MTEDGWISQKSGERQGRDSRRATIFFRYFPFYKYFSTFLTRRKKEGRKEERKEGRQAGRQEGRKEERGLWLVVVVVAVVGVGVGVGGGADLCVHGMCLAISHHECTELGWQNAWEQAPGVPATLAPTSSWTEGEKCLKNEAKSPFSPSRTCR